MGGCCEGCGGCCEGCDGCCEGCGGCCEGCCGRVCLSLPLVSVCRSRRPRIHIGATGDRQRSRQGRDGEKETEEGAGKKGLSNDDFKKLFASK